MAEELVLTDPIVVPAQSTTKYKVVSIEMDRERTVLPGAIPGVVNITVRDDQGKLITAHYDGQVAQDYIKFVNTGNFSVNSMQKRTLQKLSQDGTLPPGTVTGTPE